MNTVLWLTAALALLVGETGTQTAQAQASPPKPILDGFTADPAIRVFGDT